jgi:hypothetical protein
MTAPLSIGQRCALALLATGGPDGVTLPSLNAINAPLKRAFDKIDAQLNEWVNQAQITP